MSFLIFKARCIRITHSKEQLAREIEILSVNLPSYKFELNDKWHSDDPPNYPILAKNLDGSDISDEILESLFPIADELFI